MMDSAAPALPTLLLAAPPFLLLLALVLLPLLVRPSRRPAPWRRVAALVQSEWRSLRGKWQRRADPRPRIFHADGARASEQAWNG